MKMHIYALPLYMYISPLVSVLCAFSLFFFLRRTNEKKKTTKSNKVQLKSIMKAATYIWLVSFHFLHCICEKRCSILGERLPALLPEWPRSLEVLYQTLFDTQRSNIPYLNDFCQWVGSPKLFCIQISLTLF